MSRRTLPPPLLLFVQGSLLVWASLLGFCLWQMSLTGLTAAVLSTSFLVSFLKVEVGLFLLIQGALLAKVAEQTRLGAIPLDRTPKLLE
jgi:hypothetical protein